MYLLLLCIPSIVAGLRLGPLNAQTSLDLIVTLPLRNVDELTTRIRDIYNPTSLHYRKFLSPEEFDETYGPTREDVNVVVDMLRNASLYVRDVDKNRMLIYTSGTTKAITEAFNIALDRYVINHTYYFQANQEVTHIRGIRVSGVHGLHNKTRHTRLRGFRKQVMHPRRRRLSQSPLRPSDIKSAYNIGSTYTGSGQTIALVEYANYDPADPVAYSNFFGIRNPPLTNILINVGSHPAPTNPSSDSIEVNLDIEMVNAVAPDAEMIRVYIAANIGYSALSIYSQIANDNIAKTISNSWGIAETLVTYISSENNLFMKMAAQGQGFYTSSGDSGAYDNGGDTQPSVDDPASQPYVTAVGGTSLTITGSFTYQSETSWLTSKDASGTVGGGGGISVIHARPWYQEGLTTGSTTHRNVPDVSLNADPNTGYYIYNAGSWYEAGGTSASAPLWAAYMALVNQARLANGLGVLGFANPTLYTLTNHTPSVFHDISDGSTNGLYPAVAGYDLSTGLGTLIGDTMLTVLTNYTVAYVSGAHTLTSSFIIFLFGVFVILEF